MRDRVNQVKTKIKSVFSNYKNAASSYLDNQVGTYNDRLDEQLNNTDQSVNESFNTVHSASHPFDASFLNPLYNDSVKATRPVYTHMEEGGIMPKFRNRLFENLNNLGVHEVCEDAINNNYGNPAMTREILDKAYQN